MLYVEVIFLEFRANGPSRGPSGQNLRCFGGIGAKILFDIPALLLLGGACVAELSAGYMAEAQPGNVQP